ncbi:MAG: Aminodeoxychorismate lyase [uncultured Nocardioidaceae bacterium]|uniref:Aminodeoxychorismate lyase n=1 Tax=uncultured Nocardioidaceae bacterium TaxID=253824 RepID=A0A6J4MCD2_9ACTN|nr:MAG: Aminodeoxychorismate lyase [uncultured Nocardioidaceae bacterium]
MRAWVGNWLIADVDTPAISVLDHGLTVGDGVFETVKAVRGQPFALTRHLRRLTVSAAGLGLAAPDLDLVRHAVGAVLDAPVDEVVRVRITWTAGPGRLGSDRDGSEQGTLVVIASDAVSRADSVAVATVPWPRNERSAVSGLKTTSYAENVVALAAAHAAGASEAVFGNTRGELCEGTGSNICYVVDGEVRTPSLGSGCLAGVTRALVLKWCDVVERDAPVEVLAHADEVFLVGTTRDVQPVHRVDSRDLGPPGPLTRKVMATWAERVAVEVDP